MPPDEAPQPDRPWMHLGPKARMFSLPCGCILVRKFDDRIDFVPCASGRRGMERAHARASGARPNRLPAA